MKNPLIPTNCPSCNTVLKEDGIHLICDNPVCEEQLILKIVHWCETIKMEFFSESSIRTLFHAGKIKTIRDLYNLTPESFSGIEGFGERKITNALSQIEKTKEMSIGEFCNALGIDLIGEKAIIKLGIKNVADLKAFNDPKYVIGQNIIAYMKNNGAFVDDVLSVITVKEIKAEIIPAGANKVCMTGTGHKKRKELIEDIKAKGDVSVDSVTKDTNILVCEDPLDDSKKLQNAKKLGVKLMSYQEYFEA